MLIKEILKEIKADVKKAISDFRNKFSIPPKFSKWDYVIIVGFIPIMLTNFFNPEMREILSESKGSLAFNYCLIAYICFIFSLPCSFITIVIKDYLFNQNKTEEVNEEVSQDS